MKTLFAGLLIAAMSLPALAGGHGGGHYNHGYYGGAYYGNYWVAPLVIGTLGLAAAASVLPYGPSGPMPETVYVEKNSTEVVTVSTRMINGRVHELHNVYYDNCACVRATWIPR